MCGNLGEMNILERIVRQGIHYGSRHHKAVGRALGLIHIVRSRTYQRYKVLARFNI